MQSHFYSYRFIIFLFAAFSYCPNAWSQPAYWQFSYDDIIPSVKLGMSEKEVVAQVVKNKKNFNKYTIKKSRKFIDSVVNYVDFDALSGEYTLSPYHKLYEWFDRNSMIINYHILFINGIASRLTLYFIYPSADVGSIDQKFNDLNDFFSQVGWHSFCKHSLWDIDIRCGYEANFVPSFEATYAEDPNIRLYRHRLKISKGMCVTMDYTLNESISISFSDALALQKAIKIGAIEQAAFYGNAYFGFGLDKSQAGCAF